MSGSAQLTEGVREVHAHEIAEDAELPSADELAKMLDDLDERTFHAFYKAEEIARYVFIAANRDDKQKIGYDQVGRLLAGAHDSRAIATYLLDTIEKIADATMSEVATIAREGDQPNRPRYDVRGAPNFDD
jgi:hypothetical protein